MALKEELEEAVSNIFREQWTERDGQKVPVPEDLGLGNDAVKLNGTVLYADMAESTNLVDTYTPQFAAEVYKCYLTCAAKIVKSEGGSITAYDGDRIMAVFIGDYKNSAAAKTALIINHAVLKIINPALKRVYSKTNYELKHTVGIDTSPLFVARIGVRNDNDLVWVGRSANYAAKLCAIDENNTVFITEEVFNRLSDKTKYGGKEKQIMWKARQWTQMGNKRIYSSTWTWAL
jgi:class 3 adenylate cyclase